MPIYQLMQRSPGSVSTGAGAAPATKADGPDFRCWAKFAQQAPYNGEFGFDWIEWKRDPDSKKLNDEITEFTGVSIANFEYWYDGKPQQYLPVATDPHLRRKLQDEYERLLVYGEDYYAGWLSLRPGQQATLEMRIEALNADAVNGDYLTFGAHGSYEVRVNGQVNEAIRITPLAGSTPSRPQLVSITVKCLKAATRTKLQVLDEKRQVVGQLNVVDNTKTFYLPMRLVYLVKDGASSSTNLSALKTTIANLKLPQYLNENSLNQAHIQVMFEKTSQVYELIFKEAEWAGKYYDATNHWLTDYVELDPKTGAEKKRTAFVDKALAEYTSKYEKAGTPAFRGLILLVTDLRKNPADGEGGVSRVRPVTYRATLIYSTNLNDKSSYVHEIGHALGLDHTFLDSKTNVVIKDTLKFINAYKKYLADLEKAKKINNENVAISQKSIAAYNNYLKNNAAALLKQPAERQRLERELKSTKEGLLGFQKAVKENNAEITQTNAIIHESEQELLTFKANRFKFKKGATDALMDYNGTAGVRFYQWQWKIMQTDVTTYYGHAK